MKAEMMCSSGSSKVTFSTAVGKEVEIKIVGQEDAIAWISRSAFMEAAAMLAEEWWAEHTPEERFLAALGGQNYPAEDSAAWMSGDDEPV